MANVAAYKIDFGLGAYKDEGCPDGEFPSCLNCKLIMCKYEAEDRRIKPRAFTQKHAEIVSMLRAGVSGVKVAKQLRVSSRTVARLRKEYVNASSGG